MAENRKRHVVFVQKLNNNKQVEETGCREKGSEY
jgi:hypothetical protein